MSVQSELTFATPLSTAIIMVLGTGAAKNPGMQTAHVRYHVIMLALTSVIRSFVMKGTNCIYPETIALISMSALQKLIRVLKKSIVLITREVMSVLLVAKASKVRLVPVRIGTSAVALPIAEKVRA